MLGLGLLELSNDCICPYFGTSGHYYKNLSDFVGGGKAMNEEL